MPTVTFRIGGMGCNHCVEAVRRGLEAIPGVTVHSVSIGRVHISFDEAATDRSALDDAIRNAGYEPEPA